MIIAICGNIGAGKSTLTKAIAERLKIEEYQEPVDENPYLKDFYKDGSRYGFGMEVHLLVNRVREFKGISRKDYNYTQSRYSKAYTAVTDRIFYENRVFAKSLMQNGTYRDLEFLTYLDVEQELSGYPQDLKNVIPVYLDTPTNILMDRINKRSRNCESGIPVEYIELLNQNYNEMFKDIKHVRIENNNDRLNDYDTFVSEVVAAVKKFKDQ